jgi:hypothetical protein
MTTGSWRIGVGSGFGVLFGSIVIDVSGRFLRSVSFGRFLRAILPSSLEATFCTEGFRITISLRPSGVDRAGHFSDADWVQNKYGLPELS